MKIERPEPIMQTSVDYSCFDDQHLWLPLATLGERVGWAHSPNPERLVTSSGC